GADVVGDDAHADVVVLDGAVAASGELLGALDEGEDLVDLVHVVLALEQVGDARQARTRDDALPFELADERVVLAHALAAEELVEDEVPDLEVAVATRVDGAADGLRPELRAAVVVELRARAGRAGTPGVPEVLLAGQPDDLALVDADAREGVERLG